MARRRTGRPVLVLAATLVLAVLPACSLVGDPAGSFELTAEFTRGTGLYPGSPVRILGIDVGRITDVENVDGHVQVEMRLDDGVKVSPDATATIVPLTLLGERYVQLGPAWTDGPTLESGATLGLDRTAVPAEIDELLRSVQDFLGAIDPAKASDVVTSLAEVLDGQGADLNDLIGNASGTLEILADKDEELASIITSLGDLSATLAGHTDNIESFIRNYDLVAQLLVDNKDDVDATITQLNRATEALATFLLRHEDPLADDVDVLARTGATLDANTENLQVTLAATVKLFQAADRAYDSRMNALAANNQISPDVTADLIAGRLRDRIAGLCRRLGIELCSDPASALLNDLAGLLPGLLAQLGSGIPLGQTPTAPGLDQEPVATPPTTTPPAPTVPEVSQDDLLAAITSQLTAGLGEAQAALLAGLDTDLLTALLGLDPSLLQVLPDLDAEQIDLLRVVDPAQVGDLLLELTNVVHPPAERLEPILPGGGGTTTTTRPGGSSGGSLLEVLGGLLGGT